MPFSNLQLFFTVFEQYDKMVTFIKDVAKESRGNYQGLAVSRQASFGAFKIEADTKLVSSEAEAWAQLAAVLEGVVYLKKIFSTKGDPDLTQVIEKLKTELDQQNILEAKFAAQEAMNKFAKRFSSWQSTKTRC
ncbi:hypothetical protein BY996DRAFT_6410110 [Phakopsora pachyrhizi]|nr:hypothetical protein BY996DRAFT_6410110 [Phakopsora pachyrhizi]